MMAFVAATMARRGLLRPGPPVRVLRQFGALRRWGFGLAGELRQAAARDPDRIAVVDDERSVTYRELLERSVRIARALPVGPGDRVGILRRNSAAMIETIAGVAQTGADPVLINTGLSAEQIIGIAADQHLRMIICDDEFPGDLPAARLEAMLVASSADDMEPTARRGGDREPPARRRGADLEPPARRGGAGDLEPSARHHGGGVEPTAHRRGGGDLEPPARPGRTIVLTSGTTGLPKGARRPTPTGFGPLCSIIDRIPLHAGARVMIAAPLFHTWGFAGLQIALALRATIVLRRRFEPATCLAAAADCTALIAVPVMLQQILEVPGTLPRLSVVAVSGSALPGGLATRFMDRFGDVLYNLYGSTEASWAAIATPAELRLAPQTAGRPPRGTAMAVLDDSGRAVPPGTTGHLFVGNEMLFEGYTNGAAAALEGGLLGTGDLGYIDDDGLVFVAGRSDDMIVSGGENIFPSEVEDLLAALPAVREVAVVGVADPQYGQRLAAYIALNPGFALDRDEVREHVRQHRARYCVPRDIIFVPSLPRNATGKILKRDLPG
ncbi:AMP-binding protein [Actinoplanes sp. TBRC 11911]|uniref:AMP-binding protein n=1 Tax=Actinoplanes sp. TBRC 11911 TaxID=2729386 RepID=UPI00145F218A|nr:AMP-binding protein [Actinoplanes sp. TBRC 11911]NMO56145.1 AMP-binding protein [Actinoplanes sp. TBRC 11911]